MSEARPKAGKRDMKLVATRSSSGRCGWFKYMTERRVSGNEQVRRKQEAQEALQVNERRRKELITMKKYLSTIL